MVNYDEYSAEPDDIDDIESIEHFHRDVAPDFGSGSSDSFEPDTPAYAPPMEAQGIAYSNEWVTFLDKLVDDKKVGDIALYIRNASMSVRAKKTLTIYLIGHLDKEFSVTNLQGQSDFARIMSEKGLSEADLPLGLTKRDINAEYHHVLDLVRVRFTPKLYRSRRGFQLIQLTNQRQEVINVDQSQAAHDRAENQSTWDKVRSVFR